MTSKKEGLRLHINVGWVLSERGDFVGEEDGGRVQMLAHAVPDYASELLDFFLPHFHGGSWRRRRRFEEQERIGNASSSGDSRVGKLKRERKWAGGSVVCGWAWNEWAF